MAARLFDGQADQQSFHTAVRLSSPAAQRDSGNSPVIPRALSSSPVRAAGTPDEICNFQRKISVFTSVIFLVPKKTSGMRPIPDLSLFNKSIGFACWQSDMC